MGITEKYISVETFDMLKIDEQAKETRKVIGNDAYAVCDLINDLINKIEHARTSLMK